MSNLDAVLKHVQDYDAHRISLDVFEDHFREASRGGYLDPELEDLCASIESALSDYRFGEGVDENMLREGLSNVIGTFAAQRPQIPTRV